MKNTLIVKEKFNTKRSGRQLKSLVINMNGTGKYI